MGYAYVGYSLVIELLERIDWRLERMERRQAQAELDETMRDEYRKFGHLISYDPRTGVSTNVPGVQRDLEDLAARGWEIDEKGFIRVKAE